MKKLLGLLGTILITGNALSTVIAVAPNRKQRIKNKLLNSELNYSQTNNLEKLIRNKRQNNEDISTTPKTQDEQQSQSSKNTDSQTDIIEKEINLDENYSDNIQKMLQELIDENYIDPLRSINMGGLISKELDNKTIIYKLEELEPKMANWIKEQQNNKEKILILTLKNSNNKSIKLVINLNNLYLLGFINNQNKYFYFDDELLETIRQANQNEITELENLKTDLENFKKLMIEKNKNNEKKEKLEWKIKEKLNKLKILEKWKEELKQVKKPEEIKKIEENIKDIDKIIEEKINNTKDLNKLNKELIEAKKSKNKQQSDKINQEIEKLKKAIGLLSISPINYNNDKKYLETKILNLQGNSLKADEQKIKALNKAVIQKYNCQKTNLNYTGAYSEDGLNVVIKEKDKSTKGKDIILSKNTLNNAISNLSNYDNKQENQTIKNDLVRMIFITSEAIRFQCDEKTLEIFAEIKNIDKYGKIIYDAKNLKDIQKIFNENQTINLKKIIHESKNILRDIQEKIFNENQTINWKDYTSQLRGDWKKYSEQLNKFRIEIWEQLIKEKKFFDFFYKNQDEINEILETGNEINRIIETDYIINEILIKLKNLFTREENKDFKEIEYFFLKWWKNILENKKLVNNSIYQMENVLKNKTKIKSGNNFNLQKIKFNFLNKGNGVILSISINKNNLELTKLLIILNNKNSEMINDFLMDWSPLQYAIFHGNLDIVKLLLANGADINLQNNNGNNALITAVENGHTDIVKLLLKNGADINHQNKFGITPLITAATYGELDIVKLLLEKGTDINHKNKFGITPLITAASHDKLDIVKLLLEKGADINLADKNGNTALITAATYGKLDIVKLLLENGADINLTDENGNTALITAATYDYEKIVKLLLANGAINSHLVKNSNTPLIEAGNDQIEILKLLIENGADINLQNNDGDTALITAVENGHTDIVKLLLEKGAAINLTDENGNTALITAVENGHTDIVKLLLENGADINITDKNGNAALIVTLVKAAFYEYPNIVKLLLEKGADINLQLKHSGNTALISATSFGNIEIVKLLLENGADINLQNNKGNTALYYAICNDYVEIKDLLNNFQDLKNKIELFKKQLKKLQNKEQITKIENDLQEAQKELETLLQPENNEIKQNQSAESNSNSNTNVSGYQSQDSTSETQNQNTKTTKHNNRYDVPADGGCLFWSVATAYLLAVRNNNEEFKNRFVQLFGNLQLIYLSYVQTLFQQFDVEDNRNLNQLWYQDQTANYLVTSALRNRVVDYIRDNLDTIPTRDGELTFRDLIQENNEIASNYLDSMRNINAWGGTPEIIAMSNLLNANIGVGTDSPYQPVHQNANNNINIFHVNNGTHYNFAFSEHTIEGSGINSQEKIKNLPTTTPKPDTNTIKLPVDDHAQHHAILSNNNDDDSNQGNNITNSQISPTTKAINKYNSLSKAEKLKRLNEINRYYQTLSENDKKTFKEKLTNTGLAALSGGAVTAYGTKMTVSGTATTGVTNAEAMEMTPLLSTSTTESLTAAETITVAETAAVEGGVIVGETGAAAALAPETLGLSLVIGGLAIAGTWMYFAFHNHATSNIALPTSIHHNVYDNIEKWYKFLAHDQLKIKINEKTWNEIKQNKNSKANITKIIKNKFVINDHSGWGGSVTNEDFNTFVKVILLHFEQINSYFEILDSGNDGFVIITNTEGDWLGIE